jgi:predicted lipoprotein with Yx(FWY)xxD motif
MSGSAFTVRLLGVTATVLLASACGSTVAPGVGTSATTARTPGGVLGVATTSLGSVLVASKGLTVYRLTADTPGHSSCSAPCLAYWPLVPARAGAAVPKVKGISAALSATKATSGALMVTAVGWPLYTFAKDKAPGDVKGQGVNALVGLGMPCRRPARPSPRLPRALRPAPPAAGSGGGY